MCARCGTAHAVAYAVRPRDVESYYRDFAVCDVVLTAAGPRRVEVMKALRELTGCELVEVKELVSSPPATIQRRAFRYAAETLRERFERLGARVEVVVREQAERRPELPRKQDRLTAQERPGVVTREWHECKIKGERVGDVGDFDLAKQSCSYCRAEGTFIWELPDEVNRCPKCGLDTLALTGGWVT